MYYSSPSHSLQSNNSNNNNNGSTSKEVSPLFTKTKFGRNFMRIGFNDDTNLPDDHHRVKSADSTTRAPHSRNYYDHHHNNDGDLAYDSYDEEEDRTRKTVVHRPADIRQISRERTAENRMRTNVVTKQQKTSTTTTPRNIYSGGQKSKSSSKPSSVGSHSSRIPQAILYDQRVLYVVLCIYWKFVLFVVYLLYVLTFVIYPPRCPHV